METELAWIAGFFDGEGSSYIGWGWPKKDGTRSPHVYISAAQKHKAPLERIQRTLGKGSVTGPNRRGMFTWQLQSSKDVPEVMNLLWPYLGEIKKEQYLDACKRADRSHSCI